MAYLFKPMTIFNCVFSNFFLSLALFLVDFRILIFFTFVAIEFQRNLFPVVLLAHIVLTFSHDEVKKRIFHTIALFVLLTIPLVLLNYKLIETCNWNFIDSTLDFIFFCRDLQPNFGLFWYFFTEMFDHFRTMFLVKFQMNVTVLYLVPLSLKLRKEAILLANILIGFWRYGKRNCTFKLILINTKAQNM